MEFHKFHELYIISQLLGLWLWL